MSTRPFELIVCPASETNPRNSEASLVELQNGRLLLAYTDFHQAAGSDFAPARISGKLSSDRGRSWSEPFVIQENVGRMNVMSPSLLRLRNGELALCHCIKNSESDLKCYFRISSDEAMSWSDPVCATPRDGYHEVDNDRLCQLSTGRLLAPFSWSADVGHGNYVSSATFSDDGGANWRFSENEVSLPPDGADEPALVELRDGRVLMVFRTSKGYVYQSISEDGGETWGGPTATSLLAARMSPVNLKRIPSTGDVLVVWNHHDGTQRSPLTTAISQDNGATWGRYRDLEDDPANSYAYPSIAFVGDECFVTYFVHGPGLTGLSLKLKVVALDWLYE